MVRTEPAQLEGAQHGRREVGERWHHLRHPCVLAGGLAGESIHDVPARVDLVLRAPLQETHVLEGRHPLPHQAKNRGAEALDTGLDAVDTGALEEPHLLALQVGLGLVEEAQVVRQLAQLRQDVTEVADVENGVHDVEVEDAVAAGERRHLLENAGRALAPERHAASIDAAERAMGLRAPPAPARGLVGEGELRLKLGPKARLRQPLEVLVEGGGGTLVHRDGAARGLGDRHHPWPVPKAEPGLRTHGLAGRQIAHQVGKDPLRLAADDDVDPWKCPVKGGPHGAVAVGPAEDDGERGVAGLENLRQDQRGNVLIERRREADHLGADGADLIRHALEERRGQPAHRQRGLQELVRNVKRSKEGQILCVRRLGRVTKRRDREDPVSEPGFHQPGDGVVLGRADPRFVDKPARRGAAKLQEGEPQGCDRGPDARLLENALQETQLDGRRAQHMPGHRDEKHAGCRHHHPAGSGLA